MRELDEAARRDLTLATAARTPSEEDKARVARRLVAAVGASAALGTANSAAHAASGLATSKWAAGLTATKVLIGVGALLATALTGYALLSRSGPTRPAAQLRAAAPARLGSNEVVRSRALGDTSAGPEPTARANLEIERAEPALPSAPPFPVVAHETTNAPPSAAGATHAPPSSHAADDVARTTAPPSAVGLAHAPARSARPDAAVVQTTPPRAVAGRVPAASSARTTAPRPSRDAAESTTNSTDTSASAPSDTLAAELDLLHRAQVAWRSRDAASALALLNEHRARYPRSTLQLERDALQVLTLCELGQQAEAKRLAGSVLSRAPHSPLRASLEESCALK
jgi:hypothetical protein